MRKFTAYCDICQRVKHPNRAYELEILSHLPKEPNEFLSLDLYGPLPTGRGGARYLLVCLDVFSKHVRLYPLKSATTKSCLNKLKYDYFIKHLKPILSDHGSQFTSSLWKNTHSELNIKLQYTPIRNPESNPTERVMRELGKYF
jgi:transposase InsO family protein